ncbi:hypothetical protein BHE74_00037477 [Ensete ventricosum]|nr:hypothetical protein BHE74_00037477 [Ensete ventricosum]
MIPGIKWYTRFIAMSPCSFSREKESSAGDGSRGGIGEEQRAGNKYLPLLLSPSIDRRRSILAISPVSGRSAYQSVGGPIWGLTARWGTNSSRRRVLSMSDFNAPREHLRLTLL